MIKLIDEITELRNELSKERRKGFAGNMVNNPTEKGSGISISLDNYREFLRIEDIRNIYGLDVKTILKLYKESITSGISLEILCDNELEDSYCREDFGEEDYYSLGEHIQNDLQRPGHGPFHKTLQLLEDLFTNCTVGSRQSQKQIQQTKHRQKVDFNH